MAAAGVAIVGQLCRPAAAGLSRFQGFSLFPRPASVVAARAQGTLYCEVCDRLIAAQAFPLYPSRHCQPSQPANRCLGRAVSPWLTIVALWTGLIAAMTDCTAPAAPTSACVADSDCPTGRCLAGVCAVAAAQADGNGANDIGPGKPDGDAAPAVDAAAACTAEAECASLLGELPECRLPSCKDGRCAVVAMPDGVSCTAGSNLCAAPGACQAGTCKATGPLCDDGNPCSLDTCTALGCQHNPLSDGASCETGGEPCSAATCKAGACLPGIPPGYCKITSDQGIVCTKEGTSAANLPCLRCLPLANSSGWTTVTSGVCDDGDACTQAENCQPGGKCVGVEALCPDSGPCTEPGCDAKVGCIELPTGGACTDGNPCTVEDSCKGGKCQSGSALDCDDANPCTTDSCAAGFGCLHAPASGPCFADSDPCTIDTCKNGYCQAVPEASVCKINGICVPANASAEGLPCLVCKPSESATSWTQTDNKNCDDNNACTKFETCSAGKCLGQVVECNDNNPCTSDACATATGCVYLPTAATCNDGNACTLQDGCLQGKCLGTQMALSTCDDDNPCTADSCDGVAGCTNKPNSAPCSDGDACTKGDTCNAGGCVSGMVVCPCETDLGCGDSNPCTVDTCTSGGCQNSAVAGKSCDDGDACTIQDTCNNGWCSGKNLLCDDNNPCTVDVCVAEKGCLAAAIQGQLCTDNNPCTTGDICVVGSCTGLPKTCDDGTPCTFDICNSTTGQCSHPELGDGSSCPDDGVACTLDTCAAGICTHSKIKDNSCLISGICLSGGALHPADGCLGCLPKLNQTGWSIRTKLPCSDGNACTVNDICSDLAACKGQTKACSDGEACTADFCNPQQAGSEPCFWVPAMGSCNDGNGCTASDQCLLGKCQGTGISCDDGNPCTLDGCSAANGCSHDLHPEGYACPDDGLSCTADVCKAGQCSHTPGEAFCVIKGTCVGALAMEAGVDCQWCKPSADNSAWTAATGVGCDDGNPCTVKDICNAGACAGGAGSPCDDGNPCTVDTCSPTAGCSNQPLNGALCDDGSACTTSDICVLGNCIGKSVTCSATKAESDACLVAYCDPKVGCSTQTTCPALHSCSGGLCLTSTAGVAGPVKIPLVLPGSAAPTVAWQEAPAGSPLSVAQLWVVAQQGPCATDGAETGLWVLRLVPGGATPLASTLGGGNGSCASHPALLVHPNSYAHLGLFWQGVDSSCQAGRSRLAVLTGGQPVIGTELACSPLGGSRTAVQLLSAGLDLDSPSALTAALTRSNASSLWAAAGPYGDAWVGAGYAAKAQGSGGVPAVVQAWGKPTLKVLPGGAVLLVPAQLAPTSPGGAISATIQLAKVSAAGGLGNLVLATQALDVLGESQTYHGVEVAFDAEGNRLGVLVSGTISQAGTLRGFLAFARLQPDTPDPSAVGVLQWPNPVVNLPPHIHAFRIADLPGTTDFLVAWLLPDGSGLQVTRLKPLNDKKFVLQGSVLLDASALPAGLGSPVFGNGGLSELVLAPKGDRFTLVWQTPSGLSMVTAAVPK